MVPGNGRVKVCVRVDGRKPRTGLVDPRLSAAAGSGLSSVDPPGRIRRRISRPDSTAIHSLVRRLLDRLKKSRLAGNAAALYGAHLAGLVVPLVTVPYLARVLRPESWGLVIFAQAFAAWLALMVEYGFDLSGTRAVARLRGERKAVADVVAGVQGAKVLILLLVTAASLAAWRFVPIFQAEPLLILWAWAYAVVRGMTPFWYFQGLEEMKAPAGIEAGGKVVGALGVFVVVTEPAHAWRVLALQAMGTGAAVATLTGWMYRRVPFRLPRPAEAVQALKDGIGVFIFRASSGLYIQANAFILGLLASPVAVGFFGGAEKIIRAAINLLHPISQTLYPRVSNLVVRDRSRATRVFRLSLWAIGGLGLVMGVTAAVGAPFLVRILLGPGYEAAVPVLRVLAFLPPLIALGTVFGIQWALPLGFERPFYSLVLAAGVLNVSLALVLAPRFGPLGMAVSVVMADLLVTVGLLVLFRLKGGSFWPLRLGGPEERYEAPDRPLGGRSAGSEPGVVPAGELEEVR